MSGYIETTIEHVCEGARPDVPGRQNLLAKEVDFLAFIDHLHALMVRCKNRSQVQSPDRLMDENECDGLRPRHHDEEHADVEEAMERK